MPLLYLPRYRFSSHRVDVPWAPYSRKKRAWRSICNGLHPRLPGVTDEHVDLEEFKGKTGKPPPNWHKAVKQATAIIVDDMRTLLECHYDDVFLQRWRQNHAGDQKKAPERKGQHKVFASVVQTNRKRIYDALELPTTVKCILRSPEDETSWRQM